jgi:outer membrane protein assembly factor BamB
MRTAVAIILLTHACAASHAGTLDWPDFRGPWQDGHASAPGDTNLIGLPLRWSETENVKWKTAIHDKGWSTPVILGGQIWLTSATPDGHDFFAFCVDQATGKILSDKKLFHSGHPEPLGNDLNGYASPSPVIEPGRVYVHFGSYGTACLDTGTFAVVWQRDDLPCRHYRGPGSSPILYQNLLILSMDGIDVQYLVALDKATGRTVWKTDRTTAYNDLNADGKPAGEGDIRKAFSTPLIIDNAGTTQMLSSASKSLYCYDPLTGRELWKFHHEGFSPAARPLFDHGVIFLATGNGKSETLALRADGHSDVTDAAILWRSGRASPRMPSPILNDGLLFAVTDSGIGSCLEAATGHECWRERLGGEYASSVLYGDERVYFFNQQGKSVVLKASRSFEPLATNELSHGFMSSPAVSGKALYLRTKTDLYRIEEN